MNKDPIYCIETSSAPFKETEHGRLRRKQRGIDKKDLLKAMINGTRYQQHSFTSKYEYKDITYIVKDWTGEEVTSYAKPLELEQVPISDVKLAKINQAELRLRQDRASWTSNTVIVVDTSGSMKEADVWGTRNRLGAVWVSIALDCIAHGLEIGEKHATDIVSIITLSENPEIVVEEMPWTWKLYNRVVDIYELKLVVPYGHGPFIPCLKIAAELLNRNMSSACALGLFFFSDGIPSDKIFLSTDVLAEEAIKDEIGKLSSAFGRRLTFTAIGIGHPNYFKTLKNMVEEAREYDVKASLELPSLTSEAIGTTLTASVTSTLETQRELTNVQTRLPMLVRNVYRESKTKASIPIREVSTEDFWIYESKDITRRIYVDEKVDRYWKHTYEPTVLQSPDAAGVAMAKNPFGEGAERFAFRFFEVASDLKTIVGRPLVAKESRFLLEKDGTNEEIDRIRYVRIFCNTQQKAARMAKAFNTKLDRLLRVHADTPRIRFLDCSIYELKGKGPDIISVLVEEKLDHRKWQKWNSNDGLIEGIAYSGESPRLGCPKLTIEITPQPDLDILEEGSDEDEEGSQEQSIVANNQISPKIFSPNDVAQSFSHFTHFWSYRKRLVCDLQGVYDEKEKMLLLSDPVIHYYNPDKIEYKRVHGRTDRGQQGMHDFFNSHHKVHGHLCRLTLRGFR